MGKIWIREFTGGLDGRRMSETASGATLTKASNGHITRGGEFEKRQAFVRKYVLPAGTTGLAATASSLYVFGSTVEPVGMPAGVLYQRLQHPTNSALTVSSVNSVDLYAGKLYTIATFSDGSRHMFYDGTYVTSWSDGKAVGWFTVEPTGFYGAVSATGTFKITGGAAVAADKITSITADGEEILGATVQHTGNNGTTATAVAAQINAYTATSGGFTAVKSGWNVIITAPAGTAYNGTNPIRTLGGGFTTSLVSGFAGGVDGLPPGVLAMQVGGIEIMNASATWTTDADTLATDIAAIIAAYSGTSGFTATSSNNKVTVSATATGSASNGGVFTFTGANGFALNDQQAMSGGTEKTLSKGTFLRTVDTKVYAISGDVFYFSGVAAPTKWTTDNVGAGFIDMSSKISGAEDLTAVAKYENAIAIFSETSTIIEYVDPDPALNRLVQVLQNTGTISPLSVTPFGNSDIFYLDQSGLRSLRARDSSNSAATTDTGVAVDDAITAKLATLTAAEKANVIGCIEPRGGRFWLAMKDIIYVFSYFSGAKVSAWSTYAPTAFISGVETAFEIDYLAVFNKRVFIRDGLNIFVYGGVDDEALYDACECSAWTPYLDANDPTRKKSWTGVDAACEGEWVIAAAMQLRDKTVQETIATINRTTYNEDRVSAIGESSHLSVRLSTTDASAAKIGSLCVHYVGDDIEDR